MAKESVSTREKVEIKFPDRFNVVILNDDFTPMEFVVKLLIEIFNKNLNEATDLMLKIHEDGKAIAGSYGVEIAEQKREESTLISRQHGYPLKTILEKM